MSALKNLIKTAAIALVVAAVVQELKKPPAERTWHGRVFDFVPYDFRIPTLEKVQEIYWNPDEPRIFTDRVLGVGWGINFGRLFKMATEYCRSQCPSQPE
ncbi:MAG: DUF5808 domain-containing protein [Chloroflexi bacterium]|nr:DUF5808 domain-containing protein [Chloroflexota bacterium]